MYWSIDTTGAGASAGAVGTDHACAESGFASWLEVWVNEGFVV